MKKLAKVFAMVAGLAAMLSLSSCVLSVKAFTGNTVKIVNDTSFDVKVQYCSGAAWEGEDKETIVWAGYETKINCAEFWPLYITNMNDNTVATIDAVSPYKGTVKVSKLDFGSTGDSGASSGFDNDTMYTVYMTSGYSTQMLGTALNMYGLVKGTDYTISGTTVTLTASGESKLYGGAY